MKARSAGKTEKGFSTIELMTAFAILSIVLVGVILANFNAQYWTITAQTSNEALYKAKGSLEDLRASSRQNFYTVTSSPSTVADNDDGSACDPAHALCYFVQDTITDISSCSKYAQTQVSWQVIGYPTTTTSLFTYLMNPNESIKRGGDCPLEYPAGDWEDPEEDYSVALGGGNPTGIDVLNDVSYIGADQSPYVRIATASGLRSGTVTGCTSLNCYPANDIEVARDEATGYTYAYVAAATSTGQLEIFDVSASTNPILVGASTALYDVTGTSTATFGWRVAYYDRAIYLATRYLIGSAPEFHVFDVNSPSTPIEVGSGFNIDTSIYDMVVRDQIVSGNTHRFAYLATTLAGHELTILDVTPGQSIQTVRSCSASGPATSLFLTGNTLYLGLDVASGQKDLYAFDVTNPNIAATCTPLASTDVDTDSYSRHVQAIRASGPYLFVETNNTTNVHGQVQIRKSDPATNFEIIKTYSINTLAERGIDFENDSLYTLSTASPQLRVLQNP